MLFFASEHGSRLVRSGVSSVSDFTCVWVAACVYRLERSLSQRRVFEENGYNVSLLAWLGLGGRYTPNATGRDLSASKDEVHRGDDGHVMMVIKL